MSYTFAFGILNLSLKNIYDFSSILLTIGFNNLNASDESYYNVRVVNFYFYKYFVENVQQ